MKQIYRGTVLTMDRQMKRNLREKRKFPDGILTEDGVIRQVGEFELLRKAEPAAQVTDYGKQAILPGFIDGHSHMTAAAVSRLLFQAGPSPAGRCDTPEKLVAEGKKAFEKAVLAPGQWFLGAGYDNSVFPGERHVTRQELDQISREVPIAVTHVSGHLCAVNTKAMELLGYSGSEYAVPPGGRVLPSGILMENAFLAPEKAKLIKGPSPAQILASLKETAAYYASFGVTTMQEARAGEAEIRLLRAADREGLLCGDAALYLTPDAAETYLPRQYPAGNPYEGHLRMAGIKYFLDGSPQGRTAWLSEPYRRVPEGQALDYRGAPLHSDRTVTEFFEKCLEHHWQANVHANGDAAIEQMLNCYEGAFFRTGIREPLRPVVIHCQTVRRGQLERMRKLGMLASFFHDHVYYWGDYHEESVLGADRAARISPLAWAKEAGVPFTLHQDVPVAAPDMMLTVHNAVNRRTKAGRLLGKEQRISVTEALEAVTAGGAYQIFEEDRKGTLEPGKRADFAVLERNPLEEEPEQIRRIRVTHTVKDGMEIYRRQER